MAKSDLASLDAMDFFRISHERKKILKSAATTPIPEEYPVNALARRLHPDRQHVRIAEIAGHGEDCRTYFLKPDPDRGTRELAYFAAGKYVSVFLNIGGMPITRAYSLCSSPREALQGRYAITVKCVRDGLASRYILDQWKKGDAVEISAPEGTFEYVSLRDAPTVLCLAGGSGITPFLSLAKALADGDEDFRMILLYGSRTADGILFKEEFDALQQATDKLRVVHVLSDEQREGYEHGFINADIIRKYAPEGEYSVFVCGPQKMYDFVDRELEKLGIPGKYVRRELYGEIHGADAQEDYPGGAPKEVTIRVSVMDQSWEAKGDPNDTILQILEKNRIPVPSRCRCGVCGWCRSYLKKGKVYVPAKMEARRAADEKYGFIHPCCTFPLSDLELEVPYSK